MKDLLKKAGVGKTLAEQIIQLDAEGFSAREIYAKLHGSATHAYIREVRSKLPHYRPKVYFDAKQLAERARIRELYCDESRWYSAEEIAADVGLSVRQTWRHIISLKLKRSTFNGKVVTRFDIESIKNDYLAGKSVNFLAYQWDTNPRKVYKILADAEVITRVYYQHKFTGEPRDYPDAVIDTWRAELEAGTCQHLIAHQYNCTGVYVTRRVSRLVGCVLEKYLLAHWEKIGIPKIGRKTHVRSKSRTK